MGTMAQDKKSILNRTRYVLENHITNSSVCVEIIEQLLAAAKDGKLNSAEAISAIAVARKIALDGIKELEDFCDRIESEVSDIAKIYRKDFGATLEQQFSDAKRAQVLHNAMHAGKHIAAMAVLCALVSNMQKWGMEPAVLLGAIKLLTGSLAGFLLLKHGIVLTIFFAIRKSLANRLEFSESLNDQIRSMTAEFRATARNHAARISQAIK
jgi:hypothetical protein